MNDTIENFEYGLILESSLLNDRLVLSINNINTTLLNILETINGTELKTGILETLDNLQTQITKLQPEAITIYQLYLDTHSLVFKHNPETGELTPSELTVTVSCKKTQGDTTNIIRIPDNLKCKYGYDSTLYDLESDKIKVNSDSISSHSHLYIRLIDPNNNDNNNDDKTVDFISIPIIIDGVNGESGKNGVNIILSRDNVILEEGSNKSINLDNAKTCVYLYDGSLRIDPSNYNVSLSPHGCMASSYIDGNLVYVEITQIAENLNLGYITIIVNYNGTTYSKDFDFYVNRLGSWKEEVIGDTKRAIAESELFDVDENTGEIVLSNALAEYITSSKQYSVRLTNIENDISSASTEINAVAGKIDATVEGLDKAGITINGDDSTIELNAKNTKVTGDFTAPKIMSVEDDRYAKVNSNEIELGKIRVDDSTDLLTLSPFVKINSSSVGGQIIIYDENFNEALYLDKNFNSSSLSEIISFELLKLAKIDDNNELPDFRLVSNKVNNSSTRYDSYYKYTGSNPNLKGCVFKNDNTTSSPIDSGYYINLNEKLPYPMFAKLEKQEYATEPDTSISSEETASFYYIVYRTTELINGKVVLLATMIPDK